jgi:hypothetical protein
VKLSRARRGVETTREPIADEGAKIAIAVGVRETPGPFSRPVGLAARGFRVTAAGGREPLSDDELSESAMSVSSQIFYSRSTPPDRAASI